MNGKKYRQFSEEFKIEALKLLESSGKPISQIERELGISPGLLGKWKKRYQLDKITGSLTASDFEAAQKEIRHLKRELEIAQ